jgi:hypothetical protein
MNKLKPIKAAISAGTTSVVIYLGCYLIMLILGKDSLVKLANSLFHGVDFSSIINMNIPIGETIIGLVISFFFWGIIGFLFTAVYNKITK